MTNVSLEIQLKMCSESDFFEILQKYVECKITSQMKNILKINACCSAVALSRGLDTLVDEIEHFMKFQFNCDMISNTGESMTDYLGLFVNDKQSFQLLIGQKTTLQVLHEYCRLLYPTTTDELKLFKSIITSNTQPHEVAPTVPCNYVPLLSDNQDQIAFRRLIGSRMITCYNDAKRVTLSGWSWPSRQIAHTMSEHFALTGDPSLNKTIEFNFDYLTPHHQPLFIDAIVKTDLAVTRTTLRQSLAVSLRVDGSVDRTGRRNIYVVAHIIKRDCTTTTLGMGFGEPKADLVDGYYECVKDVVKATLSWDEFFTFVTSVVTDGEPLNTGELNGLCVKLKEEPSRSAHPEMPLFTVWCVAHRINLAWKSTCRNVMISKTVQHCINLSKLFRKSALRTRHLKNIAEENDLSQPLRYPAFFKIRWTEYVYNLLNAVLRNYRSTIRYFESKHLTSFLKVWLSYDRIHFITFLADISSLLKKFQKSCQSDSICISDVLPLRSSFVSSLEDCYTNTLADGWEQLFLSNVVHSGNGVWFHGIKLSKSGSRAQFKFMTQHRQNIIRSLINHVNLRIDLDDSLHKAIRPLVHIKSATQPLDLETCRGFIASDFDEVTLSSQHKLATELIYDNDCNTPKKYLKTLGQCSPEELPAIKVSLARIIVAKPHSADVERFIGLYNKFKGPGRSSFSPKALWNYMYINFNMGSLDQFDPTHAVDYWMSLRNRRPERSATSKKMEWFYGVFKNVKVDEEDVGTLQLFSEIVRIVVLQVFEKIIKF